MRHTDGSKRLSALEDTLRRRIWPFVFNAISHSLVPRGDERLIPDDQPTAATLLEA
jgi:hypothetical protein